jgi:hypothetical protein
MKSRKKIHARKARKQLNCLFNYNNDQLEKQLIHHKQISAVSFSDPALCNGDGPKSCAYKDACLGAVCKNNPCAVCMSDACSGQYSYIDMLTNQTLSQQDCNKSKKLLK